MRTIPIINIRPSFNRYILIKGISTLLIGCLDIQLVSRFLQKYPCIDLFHTTYRYMTADRNAHVTDNRWQERFTDTWKN